MGGDEGSAGRLPCVKKRTRTAGRTCGWGSAGAGRGSSNRHTGGKRPLLANVYHGAPAGAVLCSAAMNPAPQCGRGVQPGVEERLCCCRVSDRVCPGPHSLFFFAGDLPFKFRSRRQLLGQCVRSAHGQCDWHQVFNSAQLVTIAQPARLAQ